MSEQLSPLVRDTGTPLKAVDEHFRSTMSRFCTGVVVAAAVVNGHPVGMTAQTFLSLSLDPPLVAFAPSRTSLTYPELRRAVRFSIAVLSDDQGDLALQLSRKTGDRFAGVSWQTSRSGTPVLEGTLAWIECSIESEHDAGDHIFVIARVHELDYHDERSPLTYFRSTFNHPALAGPARRTA